MFGITILGNNSSMPAFNRHPTAQVLTYEDQNFLIDCGEGTQMQLSRYKIRRSRINHIFISHLHGDHYFGLIGLITSFGLMGRAHDLTIYGPELLQKIIMLQLEAAGIRLKYRLHFEVITREGIIHTGPKIEVACFEVRHRIPCFGFLFREKKLPRKPLPEKAKEAGIPPTFFHQLQLGEDYRSPEGKYVKNEEVTVANTPGRTYAYSADTLYDERLCANFAGASLLYHEATYLQDWENLAIEHSHSTAKQAGNIARMAGVKRLIIGHFSSRYEILDPFLEEASGVFPGAELALEGVTYRIM